MAKQSQGAVGYVTKSRQASERCGLCSMFRAPFGCTAVKGHIKPAGWCDLFEVKERASGGRVADAWDDPVLEYASGGGVQGFAPGGRLAKDPWDETVTEEEPAETSYLGTVGKIAKSALQSHPIGRAAIGAGEVAKEYLSDPTGYTGAAVEGVKSGASANWWDELSGAFHASGLPKIMQGVPEQLRAPISQLLMTNMLTGPAIAGTGALIGAGKVGYEALTGKEGEATKVYEEERDLSRARQKKAKEEYPWTYGVSDVAGSLAMPGGAAKTAATLPARATRMGIMGGLQGGASGAGAGDTAGERAMGATIGTPLGAIVGAGIPLAGAVAPKIHEGAKSLGRAVVGSVRKPTDEMVEQMAMRQIGTEGAKDIASGSAARTGLTQAQFAAEEARGVPVGAIDVMGEAGRTLGRTAANKSPEAADALAELVQPRFAEKYYMPEWIRKAFRLPDAGKQIDKLNEMAEKANVLYPKLFRDNPQGLWDEGLEQLASAPTVQQAIRLSTKWGKDVEALRGAPPQIRNPFVIDNATGQMRLATDEAGNPIRMPNLEFWNTVKKNLDKIGTGEARAFSGALKQHLDDLVPDYRAVRGARSNVFDAEDAFEAGAKFGSASGRKFVTMKEFRDAHRGYSAPEKKLFATGYLGDLYAKISSAPEGADIIKKITNNDFVRGKHAMALGRRRADQIEAQLGVLRSMDMVRNAVMGNSSTAKQLEAMKRIAMGTAFHPMAIAGGLSGASTYFSGHVGPGDAALAILTFAARRGHLKIDERVAARIGQLLASSNPRLVEQGMALITSSPQIRRALLTAEPMWVKGAVGAIPGMGARVCQTAPGLFRSSVSVRSRIVEAP